MQINKSSRENNYSVYKAAFESL